MFESRLLLIQYEYITMNKIILSIFFSLMSFLSYSQSLMISGKVEIDNVDESMDLSAVMVENLNSFARIRVSDSGLFSIKVKEGEILQFTSAFTTERNIKITSSILSKGFINVHLDLEVIELAEANLNPLKKDLKENISKEDSEQTKFYKSLDLDPNLQYIEVNPNVTSSINNNGWFNDPLLWVSALTGQRKKDIKKDEFFKKEKRIDKIEEFFTKDYFIDDLQIPAHKVNEFIQYCYAQKSFNLKQLIDGNRMEEIEEILINQAKVYLELLKSK